LLASAYQRCLQLAAEHGCRSIALPALSTGAYGYPLMSAAAVSLETTIQFLGGQDQLRVARFVLFGEEAYGAFASVLKSLS
jgi:O-acetyl-ADP-ribose deacetylase (regulator of RNase III)